MAAKRITERIDGAFAEAKVNRDVGTITGVLICGVDSVNGRTYPAEVLRRDHARYEGRPVNADHSRESTVDRRIGWFSDVRPGNDGRPRGTFNVLKSHPMYERVMEAAERNPGLFGFSHVALCETDTGKDGAEVIKRINAVESIDLVADPATTKGLFESREQRKMITIKTLSENLLRNPKASSEQIMKLKRLAEDAGAVSMEDPGDGADPKEAISAGFKSAILAVVEGAMNGGDPKDALAKIKKLLNSHNDVTAEPEPKPEGGGDAAAAAEESRKKKAAADPIAVMEECRKQGIAVTGSELKVLSQMEAVDRAAWMADQRAKVQPEQPKSGGRQPGAGGGSRKTESAKNGNEVKDVKSFLEAISV